MTEAEIIQQDADKPHLTVAGRVLAFIGAFATSALNAISYAAAGTSY